MPLDADRARRYLADFQLEPLFVEELGWDRYSDRLDVAVDGETYTLRGVAEKRGMAAFTVESSDDVLPEYATRRKIERQAARLVHEHLIVYADAARATQVWQWVRREPGRAAACRELHYQHGQSGEALIQRLDRVTFTLDEEADLSIVDVTLRARAAFDVDRVTKRFYERFKTEHEAFLGFIQGLTNQEDLEWYASLMLNRLMFVYFIQKKGFLDNDRDYLRNRLLTLQVEAGPDQFHSFYSHFLLRLFHEGLGQRTRSSELDALLGHVPYLNGGLFDVHGLERDNADIQITDEAFERLFDFFDSYQWHLDDRPLRSDNEVNPDVLGYIFEKYVNQKQMGAYYTKEDITEYITTNALIPRILERFTSGSELDFGTVVQLLQTEPDRYIPDELRHGTDHELPDEIAAGVDDPSRREHWSAAAAPSYALTTEIWREVISRRRHFALVREELVGGAMLRPSDLVPLNLNLRQLAQDVVEGCASPAQILTVYKELQSLSVLDPTCGSGAFLFAALNILEPLYEAALERMEAFILDAGAGDHAPELVEITKNLGNHPNRAFFVLKTIIVNNLYGVDIMEEAVEICKLRLFLRLVSQVDRFEHLEPLPDVDFNVRAGNSVVGFATPEGVADAMGRSLDLGGSTEDVERRIDQITTLMDSFRHDQIDDPETRVDHTLGKRTLETALKELSDLLDQYLAADYGVFAGGAEAPNVSAWRDAHRPFHWFVNFHEVLAGGGFDVILGNPPYVELRNVTAYSVRGFVTLPCADLYALTLERATSLLAAGGSCGFIVPLSAFSVERFKPLQDLYFSISSLLAVSSWSGDAHPSKLFEGVDKRLQIVLSRKATNEESEKRVLTSEYIKWYASERPVLFTTRPRFHETNPNDAMFKASLPKLGSPDAEHILAKLRAIERRVSELASGGAWPIYYTRKVSFFLQFMDRVPVVRDEDGGARDPSELKRLLFPTERLRDLVLAALSSSLFYWYFISNSDCRNLNKREVDSFPIPDVTDETVAGVQSIVRRLMQEYQDNSEMRTVDYARKGRVSVQYFNFRPSKPTIDEVDRALAEAYGLTERELDFVINYDLKYRTGSFD